MATSASGSYPWRVEAAEDREQQRAQLAAKLQPERIRATLAFAGPYQIIHEMIKRAVLDQVRQLYWCGFDENAPRYDEDSHKTQVLSKANKRPFRASLLWLVEAEAITLAQADRLDEIYDHRHELTHALGKYIIDVNFEPKLDLSSRQ